MSEQQKQNSLDQSSLDTTGNRRWFLRSSLSLAVAASVLGTTAASWSAGARAQTTQAKEFRVGWQKGSNLAILRARGNLDARLKAAGVETRWIEFTAGPQMLEGLNVGSIDFAAVGETPPVFAQAARADLVYVGHEPPAPKAEKILVPQNSPIRSAKDLKGKRIALNRGSNVHYLLVRLLEDEGLQYSDVRVVFLPPAEARAAFENGSIDAWVIWDPFAAAAVDQTKARILVDGTGVVHNYNFYLSTRPFATRHPEVVQWALEELKSTDAWVLKNFDQAARILAPQIALSEAVTETALRNYAYGVQWPLSAEVIANQQAIADTFADLKLIPRRLDVASVIWKP
ncbi:MAG: sulfonate ABC transporter substrate-binding protein [Marinospirillum sp.]|uniref:sulfonate ABC transporter substrate-binding protein n=1 Tax=Marinospirillum sp. TaxID=2183934 RepID=UPI001A04346A|nr:sulfonate ABC transporter substrate-binding protein [Marinospirillum sp.]MBE0507555.1 sulfonate ABC transporter substrate-binding protein [Marinospirillum sp.]